MTDSKMLLQLKQAAVIAVRETESKDGQVRSWVNFSNGRAEVRLMFNGKFSETDLLVKHDWIFEIEPVFWGNSQILQVASYSVE